MNIMILSTLHQFHEKVSYYTYKDLSNIIEHFSPDILAVELREIDIIDKKPQPVKQEYPKSVYPLIDKLKCKVLPLEPSEPEYTRLIEMAKNSMERIEKNNTDALKQFGLYINVLYDILFGWWKSVLDVNSDETDRHLEIKRKYQNVLFGDEEKKAWEEWNKHFLNKILEENNNNNLQKKMLVLVGVEHSYYLRKKLRNAEGVSLLETSETLPEILKEIQ